MNNIALADASTFPTEKEAKILLQSGVLAFRRGPRDQIFVLLVRKRRSQQWGIPKGKVEVYLSFSENAAKEAFEEAGVKGRISRSAIGSFRAIKRGAARSSKHIIEIWVYLLEATELASSWPEKEKRETKWVPWQEATQQLREPLLSDLCWRLGQGQLAV